MCVCVCMYLCSLAATAGTIFNIRQNRQQKSVRIYVYVCMYLSSLAATAGDIS